MVAVVAVRKEWGSAEVTMGIPSKGRLWSPLYCLPNKRQTSPWSLEIDVTARLQVGLHCGG